MPGSWQGSNRRPQLPADWARIRTHILGRDGHQRTETDGGVRRTQHATDVDHTDDPAAPSAGRGALAYDADGRLPTRITLAYNGTGTSEEC